MPGLDHAGGRGAGVRSCAPARDADRARGASRRIGGGGRESDPARIQSVLRLPDGYSTRIGQGGTSLSAGQRQRIGLARAVFGNPFLVVLDEPNANLDADGENALHRAIDILRRNQSIVIVISHRPSALAALNMAMLLYEGKAIAFGPREEIFARVRNATTNGGAGLRPRMAESLHAG